MMNVPMIYHETEYGTIHCGDSLDVLSGMADESVDCIVTDPPYGLSFMGKKWDYDVPSTELWAECLRVLKPGGHLLAFAGTRTQHRMAVRIEDAGFEIRDMIAWVYGSGFPKSLNIGKAVDKTNGIKITDLPTLPMQDASEVGSISKNRRCAVCGKAISSGNPCQCDRTYHAQNAWGGWGTALKPALEPITVARKPISEVNIAANVLKHGTGGMNIDGCRVKTNDDLSIRYKSSFQEGNSQFVSETATGSGKRIEIKQPDNIELGRFPANLIHDGSDEVIDLFPQRRGTLARFFYCAKASRKERDIGLSNMTPQICSDRKNIDSIGADNPRNRSSTPKRNHHPTVKPIALMQYLCRLVTPLNGTVLDPFFGSGSTGCAAIREGFRYIGIDISEEYCAIAAKRIDSELQQANIFREMTCR